MNTSPNPLPELLSWLTSTNLFDVLEAKRVVGWLDKHLPEVSNLHGVPQNPRYHPEICTFIHTRLCLHAAEALCISPAAKLAVLLHDVGKGLTPLHLLPKHSGHELAGLPLIDNVCTRFGVDEYTKLVCMRVGEWHLHAHPGYMTKPRSVLRFLSASGLIDRSLPDSFVSDFVYACLSDNRGRLNNSRAPRERHDKLASLARHFREQLIMNRLKALETQPSAYQSLLRNEVYPDIEAFLSEI